MSHAPVIESLESRTLLSATVAGPPVLVATIPASFPGAYIAGDKVSKLRVPVNLANDGGSTARGNVDITLFASKDNTISTDDAQLTPLAVMRHISIASGKNKTIEIPIKSLPLNLNGKYEILASVAGDFAATAASVGPVTVAPAFVDVSDSLTRVPATGHVGKSISVTVDITNNGNIPAKGTVTLNFATSPLPAAPGVSIGSTSKRINLQPGKKTTAHVRVLLPAGTATGNQYLIATITPTDFTDSIPGNNVSVSATPISIS